MLSILATEGRCLFSKWILGRRNRPYATTSNYCIVSSFGNAPPAITSLYHHLAMHHQQLLHYIIIWQCTASNYCIISSFGNAPPATTALYHHLAMHRQQLLHYIIIWQCTASNYCIISSFGNAPPSLTTGQVK